jgi:DNA processing protein
VSPESGGPHDGDAVAELRARAVWLAELAGWRRGFVGALAAENGGLGAALLLEPPAVVAAAARRRRKARSGEADAETEQEASAFAAVLARGPSAEAAAHPSVVTWVDAAYPPQLRELPDPPPALYLRGLTARGLDALAGRHVVAVVGSRSPSPYGREMARAIARDLTAAGVLVISGLALGIDAAAHEAALDAARGRAPGNVATVAVLGCGADVEHPPSNRRLFARVRNEGLLVSEFTWGIGARPWRFPARNRVMAGLSEAVVAVEGGERSGALITARYALDLGRSVFAVPGEAGRRLSAGPHRLLRQGAAVCESARDVLDELGYGDLALGWSGRSTGAEDEGEEAEDPVRRVVRALDGGVRSADQVAAAADVSVSAALALLAGLEIDGAVEACGGGAYRLRRDGPGPDAGRRA